MNKYGLMIDYEFCTGCHTCEVACKMEHKLGVGKWGIKISEEKPWKVDDDKWELKFVPIPTQLCDMCESRVSQGKLPACVHNCCAHVMHFGTPEELLAKSNEIGRKTVLFLQP